MLRTKAAMLLKCGDVFTIADNKMAEINEEERRVRVRGREGEELEWSRKAARRAGRLSNWLDDLDPSEETMFSMVETSTTCHAHSRGNVRGRRLVSLRPR